jgi:hypothetical protein
MEHWWCIDCRAPVELNKHARCAYCDSEAVDSMERTRIKEKPFPAVLAPLSTSFQRATRSCRAMSPANTTVSSPKIVASMLLG